MTKWLRFESAGETGFGTTDGDTITVYEGDMFSNPTNTGNQIDVSDVLVLMPCVPSKMFALWNNFYALAEKLGNDAPPEPLYLLKANSSFLGQGGEIRRPVAYDGRVVYEGEIGIVIGRETKEVSEGDAASHIFGYTCINDVTAADIIGKDEAFAQWVRAKSFDGFGAFGPVIATDVNPDNLIIKLVLNGDERQNYPVSDMIFPPHKIVSLISQEMTLMPGDVICCGTSVGVGTMKLPVNEVSVEIEGIGVLENTFIN